jgi:hypothetical protein
MNCIEFQMKSAPKLQAVIAKYLAPVLIVLLVLPPASGAQQSPPQTAQPQTLPPAPAQPPSPTPQPATPIAPLPTIQGLKVIALAGAGDMNDLERKVMALLVVEVLDQNDRPVEGAEVVFRFPIKGPSAEFAGGKMAQTVRTNSQGEATANGWMANSEVGAFQVHVTASYGNQIGEMNISMTNVPVITDALKKKAEKRKSVWSSKWVKIAIVAVAAGAVVGIVLATRGGSSGGNPTVTIGVGPPTIGAPH